MDKGIRLQKELAMGLAGAKAEAGGNRNREGKFAKGGLVKKVPTACGMMKKGGSVKKGSK